MKVPSKISIFIALSLVGSAYADPSAAPGPDGSQAATVTLPAPTPATMPTPWPQSQSQSQSQTQAQTQSPTAVPEIACPADFSGDSINEYRNRAVKFFLEADANSNSYSYYNRPTVQYAPLQASLNKCFNNSPPKCLNALSTSLKTAMAPELLSVFQKDTDGDMYSHNENPQLPSEGLTINSETQLPPEFLAKDDQGNVKPGFINFPKDILAVAKSKGWKALGYKTRSTGGFDSAPNLTIVAIPGRERDIYLQISPHPDKDTQATKDDPYPQDPNLSVGQRVLNGDYNRQNQKTSGRTITSFNLRQQQSGVSLEQQHDGP